MAGPTDSPEGQLVEMLAELVGTLGGALGPSSQSALEIALRMEQAPGYRDAAQELFEGPTERFGVKLVDMTAAQRPDIVFHGPKRLELNSSPTDVIGAVATLGTFLSPVVRAVLISYGWRVAFVGIKVAAPNPKIIV